MVWVNVWKDYATAYCICIQSFCCVSPEMLTGARSAFQQQFQRVCGRMAADRVPVAGKAPVNGDWRRRNHPAILAVRPNQTSPTGCRAVPPSGPATPLMATASLRLACHQCADGHFEHNLLADRAVLRQRRRAHAQLPLLGFVGIGDEAACRTSANCPAHR